jgi:hypothetical protein
MDGRLFLRDLFAFSRSLPLPQETQGNSIATRNYMHRDPVLVTRTCAVFPEFHSLPRIMPQERTHMDVRASISVPQARQHDFFHPFRNNTFVIFL